MDFAQFGFGKNPTLYAYEKGYTAVYKNKEWVKSSLGWINILHDLKGEPELGKTITFEEAKEIYGENDPVPIFSAWHKMEEKLSPEMEQLIAENTMLKEEIAGLSAVIEDYDRELKNTIDVLEKTTNKLNMVLDMVEKTNVNIQITDGIDSID